MSSAKGARKGATARTPKRRRSYQGHAAETEFDFSKVIGDRYRVKIHDRIRIQVPFGQVLLMNSLWKALNCTNDEFLVYFKGEWKDGDLVLQEDEWYFPEQQASPGSVVATENIPSDDWNVAIHRHPDGVTMFSGTDDQDINQKFEASMLFIPPFSFPAAIVNLLLDKENNVYLQVPALVSIQSRVHNIPELRNLIKGKHNPGRPGKGNGKVPSEVDALLDVDNTSRPMYERLRNRLGEGRNLDDERPWYS